MKIGVSAFLTEHSGEPGAIAQTAEHLGFESFWVAEHLVIPANYTTYYPRSPDGKVPEFYAHLADPFIALAAAAQPLTTGRPCGLLTIPANLTPGSSLTSTVAGWLVSRETPASQAR